MPARDKCSSLLPTFAYYGRKKFITLAADRGSRSRPCAGPSLARSSGKSEVVDGFGKSPDSRKDFAEGFETQQENYSRQPGDYVLKRFSFVTDAFLQ